MNKPFTDSWKPKPESGTATGLKAILHYNRFSLLAACLAFLAWFYYATCTVYISPGEFGVKQVFYSPLGLFGSIGTHDTIYLTGIHHQIPTVEMIHRFPRTIQVLTMRDEQNPAEKVTESVTVNDTRFTRIVKAAYIQTSDGFYVKLDTSFIYRIVDPVKLIQRIGAGRLYEENGLLPVVEPAMKARMGELQPEDFFDGKKRARKLDEARDLMNEKLAPMGIVVDHALARYPHLHPDVAARVEENNLQKQTKLLNISLTAQAQAEAELKKVVKEGAAAKEVALQKGTAYQTTRESERDRYERTRKAEGDMMRKVAEAKKAELVNEAYSGGGSEMLVGMKMAENLGGLDTILVPAGGENAFNPLNVESLLKLFAVGVTNQPSAR